MKWSKVNPMVYQVINPIMFGVAIAIKQCILKKRQFKSQILMRPVFLWDGMRWDVQNLCTMPEMTSSIIAKSCDSSGCQWVLKHQCNKCQNFHVQNIDVPVFIMPANMWHHAIMHEILIHLQPTNLHWWKSAHWSLLALRGISVIMRYTQL